MKSNEHEDRALAPNGHTEPDTCQSPLGSLDQVLLHESVLPPLHAE